MYRSKTEQLTKREINSLMCLTGNHTPVQAFDHIVKAYKVFKSTFPNSLPDGVIIASEYIDLYDKLKEMALDV